MSCSSRKPLKGQIWVFSGQINGLSHQKASAELQELGAIVEREVTELTDYVVVGNMPGNSPGKKVETAKILGVTLVPGAEFQRRVIGACVAADLKRAARLAGDIAKHEIRIVNVAHGLDLAQGAIASACYFNRHGNVGADKVIKGPNIGTEELIGGEEVVHISTLSLDGLYKAEEKVGKYLFLKLLHPALLASLKDIDNPLWRGYPVDAKHSYLELEPGNLTCTTVGNQELGLIEWIIYKSDNRPFIDPITGKPIPDDLFGSVAVISKNKSTMPADTDADKPKTSSINPSKPPGSWEIIDDSKSSDTGIPPIWVVIAGLIVVPLAVTFFVMAFS